MKKDCCTSSQADGGACHEEPATPAPASGCSGGCACHGSDASLFAGTPPALTDGWQELRACLAALALIVVLWLLGLLKVFQLEQPWRLPVYLVAYALAAAPVYRAMLERLRQHEWFNEFSLMALATLGAFYLGEYAEGVSVMIFYRIGEWFQESAVRRARHSIRRLLDVRSDFITVWRNGGLVDVRTETVGVGEMFRVRPGEKVGLDGVLLSDRAVFNTSALTGESRPAAKAQHDEVLAGMINTHSAADIRATRQADDTVLSRMLELVEHAARRKSRVQLFITRFAAVYTPLVVGCAVLVCLLPYFLSAEYDFRVWLYRALGFLVISCPCALVISIPLGYFGGIGLASRHGILFKGANFLDVAARIHTVALDKTGTLTTGQFVLRQADYRPGFRAEEVLAWAAAVEADSLHPVALALTDLAANNKAVERLTATDVIETPGHGVSGRVDGRALLVGNRKLLETHGLMVPATQDETLYIAVDGVIAASLRFADDLKPGTREAVSAFRQAGLELMILSGDRQSEVTAIGQTLGISAIAGNLLPAEKVEAVRNRIEKLRPRALAFVGDGFNDAPVLAAADIGFAMGGLGSDAAIDVADVVIGNDQIGKVLTAIRCGRLTAAIVRQNIVLAMGVKLLVMCLLFMGYSELWEAIFADVGVALLAILNAVRLQHQHIDEPWNNPAENSKAA